MTHIAAIGETLRDIKDLPPLPKVERVKPALPRAKAAIISGIAIGIILFCATVYTVMHRFDFDRSTERTSAAVVPAPAPMTTSASRPAAPAAEPNRPQGSSELVRGLASGAASAALRVVPESWLPYTVDGPFRETEVPPIGTGWKAIRVPPNGAACFRRRGVVWEFQTLEGRWITSAEWDASEALQQDDYRAMRFSSATASPARLRYKLSSSRSC